MKKVMLLVLSLLCFLGEGFAQNSESTPCQKEIEICFLIDATGSMRPIMNALKTDLSTSMVRFQTQKSDWKVSASAVLYRDKDEEYLTRQFQMTSNLDRFSDFLRKQYAVGGGDEVDYFGVGFREAMEGVEWSEGSHPKLLFVLSDNEVLLSKAQLLAAQQQDIETKIFAASEMNNSTPIVEDLVQKIESTVHDYEFENECDQVKTAFHESDLEKTQNEKINFEIFPNPTADQCTIHFPKGKWQLELQNENGQNISMQQGERQMDLDVSELPSGVYFINISNDENFLSEKLVVIR